MGHCQGFVRCVSVEIRRTGKESIVKKEGEQVELSRMSKKLQGQFRVVETLPEVIGCILNDYRGQGKDRIIYSQYIKTSRKNEEHIFHIRKKKVFRISFIKLLQCEGFKINLFFKKRETTHFHLLRTYLSHKCYHNSLQDDTPTPQSQGKSTFHPLSTCFRSNRKQLDGFIQAPRGHPVADGNRRIKHKTYLMVQTVLYGRVCIPLLTMKLPLQI